MREATWKVSLRCMPSAVKLLVTEYDDDVLKANLSPDPCHPRALVTLLEGLAMWHGAPLHAVACADEEARACFERVFYAGGLLPLASPLVTLEAVHRNAHRRRIEGLGDFRQLRLLERLR